MTALTSNQRVKVILIRYTTNQVNTKLDGSAVG